MLERYAGLKLRKHKLPDGSFLELRDGHVARSERFRPDRSYVEGRLASGRPRSTRGRVLPPAPRRARRVVPL